MNQREEELLVSGDKAWVHRSTPETKHQAKVLKKKYTHSAGKFMIIVLLGPSKGFFLYTTSLPKPQ